MSPVIKKNIKLFVVTEILLFLFFCGLSFAATTSNTYTPSDISGEELIPRGGSRLFYVSISGIPTNAVITNVEAQFDYIAFNGTEAGLSCRFNKDSDPGTSGGVSLVSQGSLIPGNPGTHGYIPFSNWDGQSANGNYYFHFSMDDLTDYDPTINVISVRITYDLVNPTVSVFPSFGPKGTIFSEPGTGFTPSGSVNLFFNTPDGHSSDSETANSIGAYSHSWTCDDCPVGEYSYYAEDASTGITSNTVTFDVTLAQVSVSPSSGPRGTIFSEPGTGFTPNSSVTLHFNTPDGPSTDSETTNSTGSYSHNWTCDACPVGSYQYYTVDDTTATQSNTVSFEVTASITPTVSVSPTSGPQGTIFSQPGSGFTSNSTVTLHFNSPDGPSSISGKATDGSGSYSHSWTCEDCPVGTYEYYAVDDTTSTSSSTATFEVTVAESSNAPSFVPLYRLYKSNYPAADFKDHLYTINWAERISAVNDYDYTFERIEGYISKIHFLGSVPLYRLLSTTDNSHFYTTNEAEKESMLASGYELDGGGITGIEGVEGYVYATPVEGSAPLYRLHQTIDAPTHYFLCTRQSEYYSTLENVDWGFNDQGVLGYISPDGLRDPLAHRRPQANFGGADLGSGAYRGLNNQDLIMRGRGPDQVFSHHYNSFGSSQYPMGHGWNNNLDVYLEEIPRMSCSENEHDVYVHWGDGSASYFETTCDGSGSYTDLTGNHDVLSFFSDIMNYGYDLTKKNHAVYQFRKISLASQNNAEKIVLIRLEDWAGNDLEFDYQASDGLLLSVEDNFGRKFEFSYSLPPHRLKTVTEYVGTEYVGTDAKRSISFAYNADGLLETFVDAEGQTTTYAYYDMSDTAKHQLLQSITYPEENIVEIDYDQATGQAVSVKDSTSTNPGTISYQPSTNETQVTDPENNVFQYVHPNGLLTQFKGQNDTTWTTIERTDTDNPNLPTKVTDKRGSVTEYDYDPRGNLIWIKNADNMEASFSYKTTTNKLESSIEFYDTNQATPNATVYSYDQDDNRLKTITNPAGETVSFEYDPTDIDLVTTITDARGPVYKTDFTYDLYGNLETVTDAESNLSQYENDYAGRTTAVIDAKGIKTTHSYDNNNHPLALSNYRKDGVNILRTINRLYDDNGNLEAVRWINQGTLAETQYSYDDRDRLQSVVKPGGLTKNLTYYENDLLHTREDYNNQTTTYVYDDHNRLYETQYPDATNVIVSRNENGQPTSVTSAGGASTFNYDVLNRMQNYTDPYGKNVLYDYDAAGRLEQLTYPNGKLVNYTYDNAGRLKKVTDWEGGVITYLYDVAGNLTEMQRSVGGIKTIYAYDMASRLTGIAEQDATDATLWSYTYGLDQVGNHESVDVLNEPLTFTPVAQNVSYANDRTNNRLLSAGSTNYTYDNNGNRATAATGGVTTTYSWDYENRLTRVATPGGTSVQHVYDGMGNRIARIENGNETRYVLDLNGEMSRVLAETDAAGDVTAYYVYGHGLVSRIEPTGADSFVRHFYHFNNRGDTVALSNDSGIVTDRYAFDEYGKLMASTGTTENPFKFVGRFGVMYEGDDDYFMRARFYDSEIGKFVSEDPLGFGGGDWNLNSYVNGNPLIKFDPNGEEGHFLKSIAKDAWGVSKESVKFFFYEKIKGREIFYNGKNGYLYSVTRNAKGQFEKVKTFNIKKYLRKGIQQYIADKIIDRSMKAIGMDGEDSPYKVINELPVLKHIFGNAPSAGGDIDSRCYQGGFNYDALEKMGCY